MPDFGNVRLNSLVDPGLSPYRDGTVGDRAAWIKLCNLQRRILPQKSPAVCGYHQVLAYRPAFIVTGDYHDFFKRPDGSTAIFVGDGSGHGPAASMLMAIMRTLLQTHDIHRSPGETLTAVGKMFNRLIPSDLFMTGIYLLLGEQGQVAWAAGGHHPPMWVGPSRKKASIDDHLGSVGQVLGISSEEQYSTVTWQLEQGDRLLLFTDGLWEARDASGEKFGRQRLRDFLVETMNRALDEVVQELVVSVTEHLAGADFEDDFTVIAIERKN